MDEKDFFSQLKTLKKITPALEWREKSFVMLEKKIQKFSQERQIQGAQVFEKPGIFAVWREFFKEMPVQIAPLLMLLVIFTSGGVLVLNSARKSLPGNFLYPVKLNIEKAKLAFVSDSSQRATFSMELARLRVQELDKIIEEEDSERKSERAKVVVNTIQENINRVKESVKKGSSPSDFNYKIALSLASTTMEIKDALNKSKDKLSPEVKDTLKEAANSAEQTGIEALVQSAQSAEGGPDSQNKSLEAVEILSQKIKNQRDESALLYEDFTRIQSEKEFSSADVSTVQELYEAVLKLLDESEAALESGNYDKISENTALIHGLTEKIQKILVKYDETRAQSMPDPEEESK